MKIAYLTNQYPKTSHTFIRREIEGVESAGHTVERISVRATDEPLVDASDVAEHARTRVILDRGAIGLASDIAAVLASSPLRALSAFVLALRMSRRSSRGLARHIAYFAEACTLVRWTRRDHIDHVHVHFATNPADVAMLCRALGGPPYSFTAHGTADFGFASHVPVMNTSCSRAASSLARKIEHAAFAVAVSDDGHRRLAEHVSTCDLYKLHVVRCGVDRAFLGVDAPCISSDPRLVCVARLSREKGLPVLLCAAASLARTGLAFELVLVGDGAERAELEGFVRDEHLEAHVRFVGWQNGAQVRQWILASRALVLASHSEGLPVVIMEALALRRPVIATDVGGVAELVETASNGWLVPAGSEHALASAMHDALTMSCEELDVLGRTGAERVAARHDARAQARAMAELFVSSQRTTAASARAHVAHAAPTTRARPTRA